MRKTLMILCFCCIAFLGGCNKETEGNTTSSSDQYEIMISAAASLTDALTELQKTFETEHPDIQLSFNFGSSGKLATQIEQGAPADVFLSASEQDMDRLEEGNLIDQNSRIDFAKNTLALIAAQNRESGPKSFEAIDPSKLQHLAIGEPDSVPAGRYSKQVLEEVGLWEPLQGKLVLGSDVRQVLTHVEMGNADFGMVYSSDAAISEKVKVLAIADDNWHSPIVYPGAVVEKTKHPDKAQVFLEFLAGEEGKTVLHKYGFH
ncbi:molybdate transport system substrate-binding protein [Sporosarcina luteola]|nr:molybdate transport system substrate-binding protein [Sporosarcina luteola]